jgi:hypothetical protein
MSVADAEATVTIQGSINLVQFKLYATGNATRIVVSTGIRKLMHAEIWIPIQRQCTDLKSSSNNRESVPTAWFMNITANPPTFVKAKHRCILRMVHLICRDALARGVGFRSDEIFSRTSPVLQVELNALETQEYWEPPIKAETKRQDLPPHLHSGKRRHSQSSSVNSDLPRGDGSDGTNAPPSSHQRHKSTHDTSDRALVPFGTSLQSALDEVRASLPPSMQDDEKTVEYATRRAIALEQTPAEFYAWVDEEQLHVKERDVIPLVEEIFASDFNAACGYKDCAATISVDRFYVVREGDLCNACCSRCYRREVRAGKRGAPRVAERVRCRTWKRHSGEQVEGSCYHCGSGGRSMHFYLDSWHAGHDKAAVEGGNRHEDNMAPLHPRCNWDQRTRSFDEY